MSASDMAKETFTPSPRDYMTASDMAEHFGVTALEYYGLLICYSEFVGEGKLVDKEGNSYDIRPNGNFYHLPCDKGTEFPNPENRLLLNRKGNGKRKGKERAGAKRTNKRRRGGKGSGGSGGSGSSGTGSSGGSGSGGGGSGSSSSAGGGGSSSDGGGSTNTTDLNIELVAASSELPTFTESELRTMALQSTSSTGTSTSGGEGSSCDLSQRRQLKPTARRTVDTVRKDGGNNVSNRGCGGSNSSSRVSNGGSGGSNSRSNRRSGSTGLAPKKIRNDKNDNLWSDLAPHKLHDALVGELDRTDFRLDTSRWKGIEKEGLMLGFTSKRADHSANYWSADTVGNLMLYGVLRRLAKEAAPDLTWSTAQLHKNCPSRVHRDTNNCGPSLIIEFGAFEGGGFEIWERCTHFCNGEDKPTCDCSSETPSAHYLTSAGKGLRFDGNDPHTALRPNSGNRYSVVFYCHRELAKLLDTSKSPPSAQAYEDHFLPAIRKQVSEYDKRHPSPSSSVIGSVAGAATEHAPLGTTATMDQVDPRQKGKGDLLGQVQVEQATAAFADINDTDASATSTPLERALLILANVRDSGETGRLLGVKAIKNSAYRRERTNEDKHDYEVQIEKTAKYIPIPWQKQTDPADGKEYQFHPVLDALCEYFRPWIDRALANAGKPTQVCHVLASGGSATPVVRPSARTPASILVRQPVEEDPDVTGCTV
jgi:hypothetical protein